MWSTALGFFPLDFIVSVMSKQQRKLVFVSLQDSIPSFRILWAPFQGHSTVGARLLNADSAEVLFCLQRYPYGGLQMGEECWCGNRYGRLLSIVAMTSFRLIGCLNTRYGSSSRCNMTCTGQPNQRNCGGPWANLVIETGFGTILPLLRHICVTSLSYFSSATNSKRCRQGWHQWRDKCYQINDGDRGFAGVRSWGDAVSTV